MNEKLKIENSLYYVNHQIKCSCIKIMGILEIIYIYIPIYKLYI